MTPIRSAILGSWSTGLRKLFYENGSRGREVLTDFLGDAELKSIFRNFKGVLYEGA